MTEAHAHVALRERLVALGRWTSRATRGGVVTTDDALLAEAARQLHALEAQHGVALLQDGDASLGAGFFVAHAGPPGPARLARLLRSWESFDRAFELCELDVETALFDTRLWPFLEAAGLTDAGPALAQAHLFLVDERYVGVFPEERWDAHVQRHAGVFSVGYEASADQDQATSMLLCGLGRVLEASQTSAP